MKYLTIDQSFSHTAWCYWEEETLVSFSVIRSDKEKTKYERAEFVAKEIIKIVNQYEPQKVIIEQLAFGSFGSATRDLAGLLYTIVIAIKRGTHLGYSDILFVTATGAKKTHTGNGKATKQEMLEAVPKEQLEKFEKNYKRSNGLYDLCDAYAFGIWFQQKEDFNEVNNE